MAGEKDLLRTVNKLKTKLEEANNHEYDEDGTVMKVLRRLVAIPMSLDLLQLTHIGKEVNSLRKRDGDIGKTAKQLVKSWKQLLASGIEDRDRKEREGESVSEGNRERDGGKTREKQSYRIMEEEEDRESHLLQSQTTSTTSHYQLPLTQHTSSLLTPPTSSTNTRTSSLSPVRGRSPMASNEVELMQSNRKRKVVETSVDAVAHTKRSRTQVYSGKKSSSGPHVVTSLFDMSMKILIDNIEAIEEVGGVPYLVLEPLLQKCSVSQLLRLEEFNPHFLEDSDILWKKHCEKDFRGARPQEQDTWRQLYLSKLSAREEKLKNITANIRKREEKRKEPVRQVKLAAATRAPGRRRGVISSIPLPSRPSLLNRSSQFSQPPNNVSKLKRQTMKMIKERSLMTMSHPHKR